MSYINVPLVQSYPHVITRHKDVSKIQFIKSCAGKSAYNKYIKNLHHLCHPCGVWIWSLVEGAKGVMLYGVAYPVGRLALHCSARRRLCLQWAHRNLRAGSDLTEVCHRGLQF